jgi:hypothetical protein
MNRESHGFLKILYDCQTEAMPIQQPANFSPEIKDTTEVMI